MANHGGAGNKFASVNLNKSYGQQQQQQPHSSNHPSVFGSNRVRPTGGGMVVLSRPRSSQKVVGSKLSVPPPLNLPSLRKEHERFDSSGLGSGTNGGTGSGTGSRPNSSGMGWTKPGNIANQENVGTAETQVVSIDQGLHSVTDGVGKGNCVYMPPLARPGAVGSVQAYQPVEKAMVLRGEDFPSLQATLSTDSGPAYKQKDGLNLKQKHRVSDEVSNEQKNSSQYTHISPPVDSGGHHSFDSRFGENVSRVYGLGSSHTPELARKQGEYVSGPLPIVWMKPRSDWADDERDTGHGVADRSREYSAQKSEGYWDREYAMTRGRILSPKAATNGFDKWGNQDGDTGKMPSSELFRVDSYGKDARTPNREGREWNVVNFPDPYGRNVRPPSRDGREGNSWRSSSSDTKNGPNAHEVEINRNGVRTVLGNRNSPLGKRDPGYDQGGRHHFNNTVEPFSSRGGEWNTRERYGGEQYNRYGGEQYNRYGGDTLQNRSVSKSSLTLNGRGLHNNDSVVRDKRSFVKSEKPYVEDSFPKDFGGTGFDGRDPFSGAPVGVVKRKKDVLTDFHDPVRESFEAELERVQKMQEQERQRIIEEQERSLELARREEEERTRFAREEEERRRRVEEETREAAWRAEQDRVDAIRRIEEQKISREEEKHKMLMEEERRKHAAKQKLLELEERMSRRHVEVTEDNKLTGMGKEKELSSIPETADWEDCERMVERITTSASSDSSILSKSLEADSRPHSYRDVSRFPGRGKPSNTWRRDVFENGNNSSSFIEDYEISHDSPSQDVSHGGRVFPREDSYGGSGFISTRSHHKGGVPEPHMQHEVTHPKGQRWNSQGDVEQYGRNTEIDFEFHENSNEKFGDIGWGHGRPRHSPYPDNMYHNSEADGLYSFGRSRFSMRQPRVLPPPSLAASYRGENDRPGPSAFLHGEMNTNHQEGRDQSGLTGLKDDNAETVEQKINSSTRCDSQSSLSVSSPPSSPTQLSHDEFNDSGDSPDLSTAKGNIVSLSGNEPASTSIIGNGNVIAVSSSVSDDDEEWTVENNERLQEQEEYDEVEDGYQEDDEVHEGDDENIDLTHEFDDMHLEEKCSGRTRDNLVLGFNEGVEVEIPIDEFDKNSMIEESAFAMPHIAYRSVSEQGPFDGLHSDEQNSSQVSISSSPATQIQETVKKNHEFVVQTTNASHTNFSPSTQHSISVSTGPAIHSQADLPVKLQFGLFSGPSLIPSPVPAIQIGSIQMPLHMHPQFGSSLSHLHLSQPPLFQFGQFRYTSPISQGIQPVGPPSMSFVQPSFPAQFPVNQNLRGSPSIPADQDTQNTSHNLVINAESNTWSEDFQTDDRLKPGTVAKTCISKITRKMEAQTQTSAAMALSTERVITGSKAPGPISRGRGKKFVFSTKNPRPRSPFVSPEASRLESSGFPRRQRQNIKGTEFRVRENAYRRQSSGYIHPGMDKSNFNGRSTEVYVRKGPKRNDVLIRPSNQAHEPESFNSGPLQESCSKLEKGAEKEASTKSRNISLSEEGNLKRNIEEDIDASLQSGIVRVFEQPGIEVPSDEDDFIEVRSKRQMLNDRREQREKEIKAKSRLTKTLRKPRSTSQTTMVPSSYDRISSSMHGKPSNNVRSEFVISKGLSLVNSKASAALNNTTSVSQLLAPIGTPAVNNETQADIKFQAIKSLPVVAGGETKLGSGIIFETNSNVLDNGQTSLGCWSNARIDQQVMDLTQNQLDDAMKPVRFDTLVSSLGDRTGTVSVSVMPSSSASSKDKQFASAASSVNSLLAGEKIQFGAVTSPTVLPPSSRSVSHGITAQGSCRLDIQVPQNISGSESGCNLFYKKEKHGNESCAHVEGSAAEAAASVLAVAAINSDGHVACSISVSDAKRVGVGDTNTIAAGLNSGQLAQASTEESLSVALPADLSVETTPISMWQPPQNTQNSSSQMFPPFHAPNFPYYDINPMMGGPIYTFGPHDESGGTQPQAQKGSAPVSGPLGTWPQSHSSVDSFYGPPTGFTGPFISPPGGIQVPHQHMVVYNHFAPVGQFRQVGLSFMGATYIPSGKQPDWKHNPSSAMCISEGDMNNMNAVSAQRNPPNMPAPPMQHLAPGSPLLPMPPVAMFPFQSSPDISAPNRWPSVSASPPLQPVPMSLPIQQHPEGVLPQFSHESPMDQSLTSKRFLESRSSVPSDINRSFVVASVATDQLGLEDSSNSSNCGVSTQTFVPKISSSIPSESSTSSITGGYKTQPSQHSNNLLHQQQNYSSDYNYRRGGISQKKNSGVEWSHRRVGGFQSRNHNLGAEKNFHYSKMKQIYVAKQPTSEPPPGL